MSSPYLVIAASEDAIIINDSIEVPDTYFLWYTIKPIKVITPSLEQDNLSVREYKGNIIEIYQNDFSKKIVPGSLLLADLSPTTVNLYHDLYRSGALNRSIKKVMEAFKIDNYDLPVPRGSFYSRATHDREDYFTIPTGQENPKSV